MLPPSVQPLVAVLARNTHDTWAFNKVADGWWHGAENSTAKKLHRDLIPYEWLGKKINAL